jgi:hypothetical protein
MAWNVLIRAALCIGLDNTEKPPTSSAAMTTQLLHLEQINSEQKLLNWLHVQHNMPSRVATKASTNDRIQD